MAVDYDLVVIGSSEAGMQAAIAAARLKARVALVEQGQTATPELNHWTLLEMVRTWSQAQRAANLGISEAAVPGKNQWQQLQRWSDVAATATNAVYSSIALAGLGIDAIAGSGEFIRKPSLGFVVNGRHLRSRAYLLTDIPAIEQTPAKQMAAKPALDVATAIAGLKTAGYWDARTLLQREAIADLHHLVILGADSISVELAQAFARLGKAVTLITPTPRLLPHEDWDAAGVIQAQLEAEGIEILTETTVTQVRQIDQKKWVQAGTRAIEADEILLANPPAFDPTALNLDAAQVHYSSQGVFVDRTLRTSNRRIYACRSSFINGGYAPQLAVSDAKRAAQNALFLPISATAWEHIPVITQTQPELARIGYRETEARDLFGKNIVVVQQPFNSLARSHIQGDTTGFCKLILQRDGRILGAHIVGAQASELINTIALVMQENLPIHVIADLAVPTTSFTQILQQAAIEWQNRKRHTRWQAFLEGFFNWRRSI